MCVRVWEKEMESSNLTTWQKLVERERDRGRDKRRKQGQERQRGGGEV